MKEIFKELILDFHNQELPPLQKREVTLPHLPKGVRKAIVFMGMRRSGKTWCLYQIMQELLAKGLKKSQILYLNFEDERLDGMQVSDFQEILKAYFELYPNYLREANIHFFFDEIHEIEGLEKFIRRLLDQEKMCIYLCGSSSKMLSKEIATSLRGRTYEIEIFPYSFREFLKSLQVSIPTQFGSKQKIELTHYLHEYLKWGGFPETVGANPQVHRTLIQGYTSSVIYRDIIDRYRISNSHALRQLLTHCLRNAATIFSVNKMYAHFKTMGYAIGKNTLYDYLDYFEDAYCFFSLKKYDLSLRKASQSMKKIYAIDQGLITAFSISSQFNLCVQLENSVYDHLRRQTTDLFYYTTKEGKEVDFLIQKPDGSPMLFQVSVSLKNASTRHREVTGLELAMKELGLKNGIIVTLDEEETISLGEAEIDCVPAWKFFLTPV